MIYLCASDPAALLFAGLVQVALDPLGPVLFEMRIADHVVARERHDWFCKQQQQQQRNYQGQLQVSGILLRIATQDCVASFICVVMFVCVVLARTWALSDHGTPRTAYAAYYSALVETHCGTRTPPGPVRNSAQQPRAILRGCASIARCRIMC